MNALWENLNQLNETLEIRNFSEIENGLNMRFKFSHYLVETMDEHPKIKSVDQMPEEGIEEYDEKKLKQDQLKFYKLVNCFENAKIHPTEFQKIYRTTLRNIYGISDFSTKLIGSQRCVITFIQQCKQENMMNIASSTTKVSVLAIESTDPSITFNKDSPGVFYVCIQHQFPKLHKYLMNKIWQSETSFDIVNNKMDKYTQETKFYVQNFNEDIYMKIYGTIIRDAIGSYQIYETVTQVLKCIDQKNYFDGIDIIQNKISTTENE